MVLAQELALLPAVWSDLQLLLLTSSELAMVPVCEALSKETVLEVRLVIRLSLTACIVVHAQRTDWPLLVTDHSTTSAGTASPKKEGLLSKVKHALHKE